MTTLDAVLRVNDLTVTFGRLKALDAVTLDFRPGMPASFEIDWKSVVLNNERWWNTGATVMLWSGGNKDAAGAALHEGGHGFHQLADEYTEEGRGRA